MNCRKKNELENWIEVRKKETGIIVILLCLNTGGMFHKCERHKYYNILKMWSKCAKESRICNYQWERIWRKKNGIYIKSIGEQSK